MELSNLSKEMADFINTTPLNRVEEIGLNRIFDVPIIGVADADDPLFAQLKAPEVIGPRHQLPSDWLKDAKVVVSYFLPFSEEIRIANRQAGLPATEWVYGRLEGEAVNDALRSFIVELVNRKGGSAVAPVLDRNFSVVDRRSNWSERHVAFIAGLGTFGLSKSFITEKGCAGRYGSVVMNIYLEATPRPYSGIYEYCTMCGECIMRCPSGAIKENGKDVVICATYQDNEIKPRFAPRYGCGKCQTAVPCEFQRP